MVDAVQIGEDAMPLLTRLSSREGETTQAIRRRHNAGAESLGASLDVRRHGETPFPSGSLFSVPMLIP